MIERMKKQLIWKTDQFLITYQAELNELYANPQFMQIIRSITKGQPFPEDKNTIDSIKTEVKNTFFYERLASTFGALKRIEDRVRKDGFTAASAHISVFIAMWMFDLQSKSSPTVSPSYSFCELDFRKKWEAKYRCSDGHYVRSKNEMLVDNWLYQHGICHAYEKAVFAETGEEYYSDFYIPSINLYLEIWGLTDEQYAARANRKKKAYAALDYPLLEITGDDVTHLDDILEKEVLAKFKKQKK